MHLLALLWLALLLSTPVGAAERTLPGPIPIEQARAIDGDTVEVVARIWLDQRITTRVRLAGVDTPERRGKCQSERDAAAEATRLTEGWLSRHPKLVLTEIQHDKYAGRVVGRLSSADGSSDLAGELIAAGLARAYDGGKKLGWC